MLNLKDTDILNQFQGLDKITIVKQSEFGYPIVINLKLDSVLQEDYAQYRNTLAFTGKLPRKRKLSRFRLKDHDSFYVYKGFITEDYFNDYKKVIQKDSNITITNYGTCFNNDTLTNFVKIDIDPILTHEDFKYKVGE